jgi:hypothetical protein
MKRLPGIASAALWWLIIVWLLVAVVDAEAICMPTLRHPGDDPAYNYAVSFIEALTHGKEATKRLNAEPQAESGLEAATRTLAALERVAKDFECAATLMAAEESYAVNDSSAISVEVQELARKSAGLSKLAYLSLADGTRSYAKLMDQVLIGHVRMNEVPGKAAKIMSQMDEDWRTIFSLSAAVAHVLVDPEPDAAGRLSRLRLTAAQRQDLIKRLDTAFGPAARKAPANQIAVDGTAALLREFLTGRHTDRGGPHQSPR